jgi:phosphoglycerol transferase MdoB-like AlkP superfamily enzyme
MKKRIFLFSGYFVFWLLYFLVCKILFLFYHFHLTKELSFIDVFHVFVYGSKMDISISGYLLLLPGLIFIGTSWSGGRIISIILNVYTIILLFFIGFLVFADLELYRNWGFRMDSTPLMYLKNPKEVAGSANTTISLILIALWLVFSFFTYKVYLRFIGNRLKKLNKSNWVTSLVFIPISAALILPIRGGFGIAPLNIGSVYFQKDNVFANHAAINVIWNIGYSLTKRNVIKPYIYFDNQIAEKLFSENYSDTGSTVKMLKSDKPNIIVIIMESFTNKIIEPLGGMKGITPNFTALAHEGILFSNCYASGDRTDKGILSVLNGYPGHPALAIVNFPKKTESLPYLNRDLMGLGYYSEFVYGYDIDYANFRSYFVNAKYDKVVSKSDFDPSQCNSKWGVHDHYVFNKMFEECNKAKTPFFFAFASQSSHEPFDVPMKTVIQGSDDEDLYLNSAYYADSSLGDFIRKAKTQDWWKNTLVLVIADHGTRHPSNSAHYTIEKFHIPMLWLGGALVKTDTVINTFLSQSDIPYTLLKQVNLENKNYKFSQNFLSTEAPSFGFYLFNNGFGFITKNKTLIFDNIAKTTILETGAIDQNFSDRGKAYLQMLSTDFANR